MPHVFLMEWLNLEREELPKSDEIKCYNIVVDFIWNGTFKWDFTKAISFNDDTFKSGR